MSKVNCLSWLLTCTSLICVCSGQASIVSVIKTLDKFQKEMLDNKVDMIRMEKRILNFIEVAQASLRSELKENIREEVRKAMAEVLQGETLQDMVKGQVVSDVQQLKQGYRQMQGQVDHVSRSFKVFQNETTLFQESILRKADLWNRGNNSEICTRDKQKLETELEKAEITTANLKTNMKLCTALKETCQSQMSQLITNRAVPACSPSSVNATSASIQSVSSSSVTRSPGKEKSNILIAAYWSRRKYQLLQLNIHSNSLSVYPHLSMKWVICIAYVTKTRKILIGLDRPDKIVSSSLDTRRVKVLRRRIETYGMAVDEDRDIVFISTYYPQASINRMSTQGKHFAAVIDLSKYGRYPKQIALDTRRKRIYGCNNEKLFTVTYDGQGLTTLATGLKMFAVSLDQIAGVLYYNDQNKLMKMTVSNNVSTELTSLDTGIWNLRLYRDTIYYSTDDPLLVGAVQMTYNTVSYTLKSINMTGSGLCVCLIP
ncbi:uncharacterized protein [Haliotis asinina]|uniref:uncharacterized protein n=1 Tax=Haliotis asinina TaxID=109174 RepID=UPI003531956C